MHQCLNDLYKACEPKDNYTEKWIRWRIDLLAIELMRGKRAHDAEVNRVRKVVSQAAKRAVSCEQENFTLQQYRMGRKVRIRAIKRAMEPPCKT